MLNRSFLAPDMTLRSCCSAASVEHVNMEAMFYYFETDAFTIKCNWIVIAIALKLLIVKKPNVYFQSVIQIKLIKPEPNNESKQKENLHNR